MFSPRQVNVVHAFMNNDRLSTNHARATICHPTSISVQGANMSEVIEAPTKTIDLNGRVSIYQPEQAGLIYPELPAFSSHAEHRRHLKERLVGACRAFALQGFDYGFAGHLTVRDPEHSNLYWTNPM